MRASLVPLGTIYVLVHLGLGLANPAIRWIAASVLLLSLVSVALYGWDKAAAKRKGRRIPERLFHLSALLGGWPGAAFAQGAFRHKTAKRSFQSLFVGSCVLNVTATAAIDLLLVRYA